ncbi:TonB-linked outer membrane protein, SusC/RagA family [Aequorivita sublithincola DSM 14238]|uniref:TonB-linked outer membrane protein, SusC/RagA family n=1 Tax=Aequorivita sublithincola (strain DSM 14238 / LMG 21431 / ACAM 643 / 9-3) TaxID=746697 RepID=I3YWK7_AEQSU|nr:SusC/RagA family TonB-linked outer membrane protein [Aequorivita sublithincola]AFL81375.1 TonB-linked outer membrane protein, SusC/RagA family [Aequorivita sublithincola DSM 14238]
MRTKFSGILTLILALVVQLTFAQQKTITGTVTDDTGLPLPGANVIIKGTSSGTQTDFDGNYSISANVGQAIAFSYVGFVTKEVKVGAQNSINVTLQPDAAALEEVVVTGYSTRNQTVQTSAVVSISASELSQMAPTTSIDNMLQGKAAGVQVTSANGKPGQGAFVRIRGTGSLVAGASSPLYIVDGAPIREQDLASIPNEDIENITILKDAPTTARYGSRGANGVVVITTKNGNRNKDAVIRYSSRYGTTTRIEPNFTLMNAEQKLQYEAEMYALGVGAAGSLPGVQTAPGSPERAKLLARTTDWADLILKEGVIQNNNVSVSGGSEKVDYYFSVTHDKNTGIIDKINGFERLGTRLNVNFDAKEWLTMGVNVGYSRSTSDEPRDRNNTQNPFQPIYVTNEYENEFLYDDDGEILLDNNGEPTYNPTHRDFATRKALETEKSTDINNVTLASVDALVKLSKNWSYGFNTSVNHLLRRRESYSKPGGVLDIILNNAPVGNKFDDQQDRLDLTISNRLNYTLNSNNHNLNVLGLYEYNLNEFYRTFVRSTGFPSPLLSTQTSAADLNDGFTNRNRLTLVSYGLFADYDYKEKYLLSASIRRDGSSNFGADFQYGTFYSGSIGWNVAKEDFFGVDAVNDLKIRAAYGSVGNRNGIGRYAPQATNEFGFYPGGSSSVPSNIASPNLKWETTTTANVGLEFNLFNKRLRGVTDYFIRNTSDLLFNVPTAYESGTGSVAGNIGEIQNKGLEISLQGDIVRTNDFTWTLGGNIIFLDTEVIELPDHEDFTPSDNTYNIRFSEGRKINEHYLVRYAGVDAATGKSLFLGADGNTYFAEDLPEGENRVFQGKSTIADKEGGFFTNFSYKGFGLRADFVFKTGNWINNFVRSNAESDGQAVDDNQAVTAFNYWQQPGDTGVMPSPIYASVDQAVNSDRFLEKGDYVRMRNVTLSYNFPSEFLDKTPIQSLRLYVQGQNLLTFTKFWGDPEVGLSSGETISFADAVAPGEATLYSYPNVKSFQFGLDVSF